MAPRLAPLSGAAVTIAVQYATHRSGIDGFVEAWSAVGGTAETIQESELSSAVARFAAGRAPLLAVAGLDVDADLRWPVCGLDAAAGAAIGVVRAAAGIAQTGSIVLRADDNFGRAASLLPPAAVFVLSAETIVDTPGDYLRAVIDPPSQLVLVTGPSRSADIEMQLVVGVHGPGEVHVVIVA